MIKNYFKIAWRNLWRHKRMTFINVTGLGIGMAATVLIVIWVQNELSFDRAEPDSENIYRIKSAMAISANETWFWETSQYVLGEHAVKEIPEIGNITRLAPNSGTDNLNFRYGDKLISEQKSAYVDEQWFKMFHYDFIEGSRESFIKNPFSLILTESAAKIYFGNEDAVGKVLRLDTVDYQVQAVVKDNPANSSFQYNVLMPVAAQITDKNARNNLHRWGEYGYLTFLKLKPGANTAKISAKLNQILTLNRKGDYTKCKYSLVKIKDMHFETDVMGSAFIHGNHTLVNVFIVLAVLLLVTACINYVNLTTARASIRSKEVSVRKVVGAGRGHLFGQFMSESVVVSLMALVLCLLLVQLSLPWFRAFTDKQFTQPLTSLVIWVIIGTTLLVSFLLNGLYPAALLSSFQPLNVFRGRALLNFKDALLRKSLVVVQFTISVVLIIGTLVIYKQLNFVEKIDLGYNKSHIFEFELPRKVWGKQYGQENNILITIKNELKRQGSIADVTMSNGPIVNFQNSSSGSVDWPGRPKDFEPFVSPLEVDQNFAKMMNLKVVEGRWFNTDKSDERNMLLNETAVQMLHLRKPVVGQRFIQREDTGVIIGVVKDFHYKSLHDKIGAMIIAEEPGKQGSFYIKTQAGSTPAAIAAAKKVWDKYVPGEPFKFDFLDETYNNLYKSEQKSSILVTLFASIAIFVSALGLLGLAAFAAEQRVKEIGIRKVLGASVKHIVSLLSINFVKMVIVASLIAFPISWWAMNKWLQEFSYRINLSWLIFAGGAGIALLIALVTVSVQSVKAAVANPIKSLRNE